MRSKSAPVAVVIVVGLVLGVVTVVVTGGTGCGEVFKSSESRLRPASPLVADGRLTPNPDAGIGGAVWVLSTDAADTRTVIVDVGSWTVYLDRTEVSRISDDGTIAWTRSIPRSQHVVLGDKRLGLTAIIDGELRLAVLTPDGGLARCDTLFDTNAGIAPDAEGGYLAVGGGSSDGGTPDTARRIDADGSDRWTVELDGPPGRLVADVYVGGGLAAVVPSDPTDRSGGAVLVAFDDDSGHPIWDWDSRSGSERVTSVLGVVDDLLYITVTDTATELDQLMALDVGTGRPRWSTDVSAVGVDRGRLLPIGESVVIGVSDAATAIDPGSGQVLWRVATESGFGDGDRFGPVIEAGGESVLPVTGGGRLIDLADGRSTPFFTGEFWPLIDGIAVGDDILIADVTVLLSDGDSTTFVAGWPFDPATATFTDAPLGPGQP